MRTKISLLVVASLLFAVFVGAQKKPKPPKPVHLCQALSDVYVNATTSADLVVSLPPHAVRSDYTVWAREDAPSNQWKQCPKDGVNLCPIGVSGFQNCKVEGTDPRDGAEKFGCVFRNDGTSARRARLVVIYKEVPICCKP
jgi:hypothetical protein